MPRAEREQGRSRPKKGVLVSGIALVVTLMGLGSYLAWNSLAAGREKAKAEVALRSVLDRWCSDAPLAELSDTNADPFFEDPSLTAKLRPTRYELTALKSGKKGAFEARVTLTFIGGAETRVYEITVYKKSGKSLITTLANEDISGTEFHARPVLQSWLDAWAAGEDMAAFKKKHPEADAKMTMDITWADLKSKGKRLVRYEITSAGPRPNGFRFSVTAVIEDRGTTETRILTYHVYKDRLLSDGRWTISGW